MAIRKRAAVANLARKKSFSPDGTGFPRTVAHKYASIAVTIALHVAIVALVLLLASRARGLGLMIMVLFAQHLVLLLGFSGPAPPGKEIFRGVGYWVPSPIHEPLGCGILCLIAVTHYFGLGLIEYSKYPAECGVDVSGLNVSSPSVQQAVKDAGCTLNPDGSADYYYTIIDRVYFTTVLLTTVGYGNTFVPVNPLLRIFTLTYAMYGFLVFGTVALQFSTALREIYYMLLSPLVKCRARLSRIFSGRVYAPGDEQERVGTHPSYETVRGMYITLGMFVVINFGSAAIFLAMEEGWTWNDAMYHCAMTATTIGLGDIAPQTQGGRAFSIFHMWVSVLLFGAIINTIISALEVRNQLVAKQEALEQQLDESLICSLDRDGDGVDRAEYALGMLEIIGLIRRVDYEPFLQHFDEMDNNGDGRLTKGDLSELARRNREKHLKKLEATKAQATRTMVDQLHKTATAIMFPSGILVLASLWDCLFGYVMLASGMLDGLVIVWALGVTSTTSRKSVSILALVTVIPILLLIVAFVLVFVFVIDPTTYLHDVDQLFISVVSSSLQGGVSVQDAGYDARTAEFIAMVKNPGYRIVVLIYNVLVVYAIAAHVNIIIKCLRLVRHVAVTVTVDTSYEQDSVSPAERNPAAQRAIHRTCSAPP